MTPPLAVSPVQILSEQIDKPELDDRSYRLIKLTGNNLRVLLVHDPLTEKSSAAVDVNVGSQSDPKDFQGLAHALEHCLFLGSTYHTPNDKALPAYLVFVGTKKYPVENDYSKFLNDHSGHFNAYTGIPLNTNYWYL
jgi:insulysin